jgi:hypothetical protein
MAYAGSEAGFRPVWTWYDVCKTAGLIRPIVPDRGCRYYSTGVARALLLVEADDR